MASEENKNSFKGVRSMFLAGSVSKMKDIEDLYPTNIAKAIDMQLIIDIIKKELQSNTKVSKKKPL